MVSAADIRAEASHQRQSERIEQRRKAKSRLTSQKSRSTKAEITLRSERKIIERREAIKAKEEARVSRQPEFAPARPLNVSSSIAQHRREIAAQEKAQAGTRVASGGGGRPGSGVVKSLANATPQVHPNPGQSNLWLILFLIFGLIIFYLLSTHPGQTQGVFGTLTNGLNAVSSTRSLFTATPKSTASAEPSPSAGATNQTNTQGGQ